MKFLLALLAGAVLVALPLASADAQDPLPAPMPCVGAAATDKTGDVGALAPVQPGPNFDITSFFFRVDKDAAGKPALSANMQIAELSTTAHADVVPIEWDIYYTVFEDDNDTRVAAAILTPDGTVTFYEGVTYQASVPEPPGTPEVYGVPDETTGQFIEGKNGIIQIAMPPELAGKTLKDVFARTRLKYTPVPHAGFGSGDLDRAPDGTAFGKEFKAVECPAEPEPTPAGDGTDQQQQQQPPPQQPPPSQPQPQPQPQPTPAPQGQPAPGSPLPATGTLTFDVAVDKGKRKTAVKRGLRGRVRCSVQCKVTATAKVDKRTARKLKLGRKAITVGKGKASIKKAGRIPFYVKMTKKAKRALKRKGVKKFALKVSFRVTDNQGKQVKKVTRKSTLR